jgi:hypothetical protein
MGALRRSLPRHGTVNTSTWLPISASDSTNGPRVPQWSIGGLKRVAPPANGQAVTPGTDPAASIENGESPAKSVCASPVTAVT